MKWKRSGKKPKRMRVRHKRLELSLREEPDPKSGASTNSANAAERALASDADKEPLLPKRLQKYDFFLNYAREQAIFLS